MPHTPNIYYLLHLVNGLVGTAIARKDGRLTWTNRLYNLLKPADARSLRKILDHICSNEALVKLEEILTEEFPESKLPHCLPSNPRWITAIYTTADL